jgi:hypothetical protein
MKKNLVSPLSVIKTENNIPIMNSNDNHQFYQDFHLPDQLQVNRYSIFYPTGGRSPAGD